jgi:hypothetical protein
MAARRFIAGLVALLALICSRADVSGTYENVGTVVSTALASAENGVPLRGLVGLEFDLPLARALFSATDHVTITQAADTFAIECRDADGGLTWNGRWDRGYSYGVEAGQVKLLLRAKRYGQDGFLFLLSPVSDQKLLLVEVQRIQTTYFGPVMKPIGTFLFERRPDARTVAMR